MVLSLDWSLPAVQSSPPVRDCLWLRSRDFCRIVQILWTIGQRAGYGRLMELSLPDPEPDPLGEALQSLRMSGAFYCHSELTAPWGLALPALPGHLWFHVVASGGFELEMPDGDSAALGTGECALVTRGTGHVLRSGAGAPAPPILDLDRDEVSERYEVLRHGGGGAPTRLLCGAVRFDHPAAHNLVDVLPDVIRIDAGSGPEAEALQATLRLLAAEARSARPGGAAVVTRLADIVVIQMIRAWIEAAPGAGAGWLGALRDPQIGRALRLIHDDPARDWTVAGLARELAMSRSAFAARFTALVGEPAMAYLARWRMQLATTALREDGAAVAELAAALGYRSEAAFARAFKRVVGIAPGAVRRSGGRAEELERVLALDPG
jgi:AraC-like DNA-binding protein